MTKAMILGKTVTCTCNYHLLIILSIFDTFFIQLKEGMCSCYHIYIITHSDKSLTHNYSEMYKLDFLVQLVIIAESGVWGFPTFLGKRAFGPSKLGKFDAL